MAKAEQVVDEKTNGAPDPDDAFDIELPEDMDVKALERAIQTPPEEDKTPKVEAKADDGGSKETVTSAVTPEKQTAGKGSIGKALAAERKVVKDLKAENKRLRDQWAEIERERAVGIRNMHSQPLRSVNVQVQKPDAAPIIKAATEHEARGESSAPVVTEQVLEASTKNTNEAFQKYQAEQAAERVRRQERELAEDLFEDTGENLYEILERAGIYDAVTVVNGTYKDKVISDKIYASANPAKAALRIARAKLASEQPEEKETGETVETPLDNKEPERAVVPAKAVAPDAVEAARREGAREAVETITSSTQKHRGVRVFTSAGSDAPKVGRTPEFWDALNKMMDKSPDKFLALMDRNPEISTWFDNGRPKQ